MANTIYARQLRGRNIRLLELLPGHSNDPLRCRLVEVSLDDEPTYEALSYAWGEREKKEQIQCDNNTVQILVSLSDALRRLRLPENVRMIWADAMCINQDNIDERNHQVQMMGDVYSYAKRVVVCLGPDNSEDVKTAIFMMKLVHSECRRYTESAGLDLMKYKRQLRHPTLDELERLMDHHALDNPHEAAKRFFQRPWFERLWCVQEIILAREAIVYCGDEEMDWACIGTFALWRRNLEMVNTRLPKKWRLIKTMNAYRMYFKESYTSMPLASKVEMFAKFQASDPKDKAYGLMGIGAGRINTPCFTIDYGKSVAQIYMEVIVDTIRHRRKLSILEFVRHTSYDPQEGFPSWVRRWDKEDCQVTFHPHCQASAGRGDAIVDFESSMKSRTLSLHGIVFETIRFTSHVLVRENNRIFTRDQVARGLFLRLYREINKRYPETDYDLALSLEAVATTFTGGFLSRNFQQEGGNDITKLKEDMGRRFLADFQACIQRLSSSENLTLATVSGDANAYESLAGTACRNKRMLRTTKGYLGLGPECMREGDVVAVFDGGRYPFVLRPLQGNEYFLMGACYIYDIMNGEAYDMEREGELKKETFVLR